MFVCQFFVNCLGTGILYLLVYVCMCLYQYIMNLYMYVIFACLYVHVFVSVNMNSYMCVIFACALCACVRISA